MNVKAVLICNGYAANTCFVAALYPIELLEFAT